MRKALSSFFERAFGSEGDAPPAERRERALRVATALLLIEVARADYEENLVEDTTLVELIKTFFDLSDDETEMLIEEAEKEADHAASLQTFTRRLHEALTVAEKLKVVEMLWKVAYADERLDKHEDYVVRKVADLLYVPHSDLIRIRNRVRPPSPSDE
jgi:uncharacterized tellurite resistance protein B-like protein